MNNTSQQTESLYSCFFSLLFTVIISKLYSTWQSCSLITESNYFNHQTSVYRKQHINEMFFNFHSCFLQLARLRYSRALKADNTQACTYPQKQIIVLLSLWGHSLYFSPSVKECHISVCLTLTLTIMKVQNKKVNHNKGYELLRNHHTV